MNLGNVEQRPSAGRRHNVLCGGAGGSQRRGAGSLPWLGPPSLSRQGFSFPPSAGSPSLLRPGLPPSAEGPIPRPELLRSAELPSLPPSAGVSLPKPGSPSPLQSGHTAVPPAPLRLHILSGAGNVNSVALRPQHPSYSTQQNKTQHSPVHTLHTSLSALDSLNQNQGNKTSASTCCSDL